LTFVSISDVKRIKVIQISSSSSTRKLFLEYSVLLNLFTRWDGTFVVSTHGHPAILVFDLNLFGAGRWVFYYVRYRVHHFSKYISCF
jgi:hypothetical protein